MKKQLLNVTLIGIDCIDIERLKLAADICQKDFEFGAVKLLTSISDTDARVVAIDPINSIEVYSYFCLKKLDDFVDTDYAIIIQYDGFILNPEAWTNEFLNYDYIGAPWWYGDAHNVGNGGFSLRSKKLLSMLYYDTHIVNTDHPEDHDICRTYGDYLQNKGITFAPESLAKKFSIEGHRHIVHHIWEGQFGFHGLRKTDISAWLTVHPEYPQIKNIIDPEYLL